MVARRRRHDVAGRGARHAPARCWTSWTGCGSCMRVEPADVTADWALLSLVGPASADAGRGLGVRPLEPRPRWRRCRRPKFAAGTVAAGPHRRGTPSRALPGGRLRAADAVRGRPARAARPPWPTWWPRWACRWPGCGRSRRCGSRRRRPRLGPRDRPPHAAGRGRAGWPTRCTWTRAATAARRRSPGCTTWAGRRAGWCCCTSTASPPTSCPRRAPPVDHRGRPCGRLRRHRGAPLRAGPGRAGPGQAERRRRRRRAAGRPVRRRRSTPEPAILTCVGRGDDSRA